MTSPDVWRPRVLTVYGVDTCDDTTRARHHFDGARIPYYYVNLDLEPAVKAELHAAGWRSTPVVVTPDGVISMEPTDIQLFELVEVTRSSRSG